MLKTSLLNKKKEALDYFTQELLQKDEERTVARIILFGSVAKGIPSAESDIDVLIFTSRDPEKVSMACADSSLKTSLLHQESIEPLVYCIDDFHYPPSYFLHKTIQQGKEVYKMDEQMLKSQEAENYWILARNYLEGAKKNHVMGEVRITVDAGYNACELCLKGFLLLKLDEIPKTHGGIVTKFGELYIKTQALDASIGRDVHLMLEKRNKARYDCHAEMTQAYGEQVLSLAEKLIRLLGEGLQK